MADSLIRLRISSEEYDNKLKRAAEGLNRYIEECRKAGGTLEYVDDGVKEFTQQLGKMGTVAGGAKGKLGEMTKAFTDLTMQFNTMSEAEKNGQFGKALSSGLDELKQRIISTKQELADINNSLNGGAIGSGSLFSSDKLSGMLQVFGGNLMTKGAGMVMSFAGELKDMVAQGIELAKAGEGVRLAFQRLGRGDILQGLREATHGTVTDLELMKAAVKFNDFKLPLDELGTMLAFAQQKAKDTGQSVDYMVDSIVTGLGRKSLMILDNLGLSAAQIKERMAETGDMTKAVGEIIREQMSKAGDYVETAADRATQANVELENAMTRLGETFQPLTDSANSMWTDIKVGALDLLNNAIKPLIDKFTELGRMRAVYEGQSGDVRVNRQLDRLKGIQTDSYRQGTYKAQLRNYDTQIASHEQYLKDYKAWQSDKTNVGAYDRMQKFKQQTGLEWVSDVQAHLDAFKKMRSEYVQGAKAILEGNPVPSPTSTTTNTPTGTTTTTTTKYQTPQQRAQESFTKAEQNYKQALEQAAMELQAGTITRAEAKKKEMQAAEQRWKAIGDARNINDSDRLRQAQDEAAAEYTRLAAEVKQMDDAIKASKIKWETGASGFNAETMTAWMKGRQSDLQHANYGTEAYNNIAANIADMTTIKTIIEQRLKAGMEAADTDGIMEQLWERVFDGENIPDEVWQSLTDRINEKLKELGIKPISINFKTGEENKKEDKQNKKDEKKDLSVYQDVSRIAGSVQGMLTTLEQLGVKIPDELKGIMSGVQSIIEFMSATSSFVSAVAGIKMFGFAHGGMIKAYSGTLVGNTYSGDQLRGIDNQGQLYGLNAGEVVLNRAQTGNIASQLSGNNGGGQNAQPFVTGDIIYLGLQNYLQENGYGKIVTTNMR